MDHQVFNDSLFRELKTNGLAINYEFPFVSTIDINGWNWYLSRITLILARAIKKYHLFVRSDRSFYVITNRELQFALDKPLKTKVHYTSISMKEKI